MNEYDLLGRILLELEKLSSYVVRFLLWAGVVGNTTPAASFRATLPNTELSAVLYGETKMPKRVKLEINEDEALHWLKELEVKMPDPKEDDALERMIKENVARWRALPVEHDHTAYFSIGYSSSTSANASPKHLTYEESHDLSKYKCGLCNRGPVQLWRNLEEGFERPRTFVCLWCLGDITKDQTRGRMDDVPITIESKFGLWVPAIPYKNDGEYLNLPRRDKTFFQQGVDWWLGLGR